MFNMVGWQPHPTTKPYTHQQKVGVPFYSRNDHQSIRYQVSRYQVHGIREWVFGARWLRVGNGLVLVILG